MGVYSRRVQIFFLVVDHIPFEIFLPIKYFLMLHRQAIACFLRDNDFHELMAALAFLIL